MTAAAENLGGIGTAWLEDPFPLLRQALENAFGYGGTIFSAAGGVIDGTINYLSFSNEDGLWAQLETAGREILQGNISTGFATLFSAFVVGPLINIGLPIFSSGLLEIPVKIVENAGKLVTTLFSLETLMPLAFGALMPIGGFLGATGDSLQASFDALIGGRLIDAVVELINLPAAVVGAVLNGYTLSDGTALTGLFSFSDEDPFAGGLLQTLFVTIPKALAAAIAPEAPAAMGAASDSIADDALGAGSERRQASFPTDDEAATGTSDGEAEQPAAEAPADETDVPAPAADVPAESDVVTEDEVAPVTDDEAPVEDTSDEVAVEGDDEAAVEDDDEIAVEDIEEQVTVEADNEVSVDNDNDDAPSAGSGSSSGSSGDSDRSERRGGDRAA
ncbi:hypothetical protein ACQI4F_12205 [Mycolicibacterium vaccae]|uniref:hypothetical protein n=1 Tax=Mycolicibacterium vaccae TaxID=1810 RepID=UPI003CE6AB2F